MEKRIISQEEINKRAIPIFVERKLLEIGGVILALLASFFIPQLFSWDVCSASQEGEAIIGFGCIILTSLCGLLILLCAGMLGYFLYQIGYSFVQSNWETSLEKAEEELKKEKEGKNR